MENKTEMYIGHRGADADGNPDIYPVNPVSYAKTAESERAGLVRFHAYSNTSNSTFIVGILDMRGIAKEDRLTALETFKLLIELEIDRRYGALSA